MKHIVLAVPAYTGTVHMGTMRSIVADTVSVVQRGDVVSIDDECGSAELRDNRAAMAARFLAGDGAHLVSIDHDVIWPQGTLLRIVDYPVDVVAAIYPKREDPISFPVRYLDKPTLEADPVTGLLELEMVQGGFICMSRACLTRMCEHYRDLSFWSSRYPGVELPGLWRELMLPDGSKLGEDYAFCHRWRAIGGQVWSDPNVTMAHVGLKAFIGNFGEWLKSR